MANSEVRDPDDRDGRRRSAGARCWRLIQVLEGLFSIAATAIRMGGVDSHPTISVVANTLEMLSGCCSAARTAALAVSAFQKGDGTGRSTIGHRPE